MVRREHAGGRELLHVGVQGRSGGGHQQCGWLKDRFGLSWQVIPKALGRFLMDENREKANRVMQAMLKMKKIVIADLEAAYEG
jgi:predicted 3-demethylubiquinone-9 3-methyltransferase (glyoxalase superfamily)